MTFNSIKRKLLVLILLCTLSTNLFSQKNKKVQVRFYPMVTVNNLGYSNPKFEQNAKSYLNSFKNAVESDTVKFKLDQRVRGKFIELYQNPEKLGSIAIVPIYIDKLSHQEICFFSYDCQEKKFLGIYYFKISEKRIEQEDYFEFKQNLFEKNKSDIRKGEIRVIFESYYFYYIAEWHQFRNTSDTASIYFKSEPLRIRHEKEYDYTVNTFINEYKYYKTTNDSWYINRFHRAVSSKECPRELFPTPDNLKDCIKLRKEMAKYPATIAYIDALSNFEKYKYYIKRDVALSDSFSTTFSSHYDYFSKIMDNGEYSQNDIKLWEREHLSLFFEQDTLNTKYKILSKCSDISSAAFNYSAIGDYDKALQFHFWALKFCHSKSSFDEIASIISTKEKIYRRLLIQGDSLCILSQIDEAKDKYRESLKFTLFPEYSILKLSSCSLPPPPRDKKETIPPIPTISPEEVFRVIKNIINTYNIQNYNELPGQQITFEVDEQNRKKITVFITTNTDATDFVLHASYYPPGSYKFLNEDTENGMLTNVINSISNTFKDFIDSTGIEMFITGSADLSGFKGSDVKVEREYKNINLYVQEPNGKIHNFDDLISSYSDYDKNLALAFLRGYRKEQAILSECIGINIKSTLTAKVEGRGSEFRNVKIVLRILLK